MKRHLCTAIGMIGASIGWIFGGFDAALTALLILMVIDYVSGCIVALVFHASPKTDNCAYDSRLCLKGLCKKILMLLTVILAVQIDRLLGVEYVRDAVCIGLAANEVLSIVENLGHAGIPMPKAVIHALEQLQKTDP